MKASNTINWKEVFAVVTIVILAFFILNALPKLTFTANPPGAAVITYADLAAIVLSCVSILVTILGVIIAIVTFIGYRQIKFIVVKKAEDHVKESVQNEQGDLYKLVQKEVKQITYKHLLGTESFKDWPPGEENRYE